MSHTSNAASLEALCQIQQLSSAINALIARDYVNTEEEATLDDLERYLAQMEADFDASEKTLNDLTASCAVIQPKAEAGAIDPQVTETFSKYGTELTRLYRQHLARFTALQNASSHNDA